MPSARHQHVHDGVTATPVFGRFVTIWLSAGLARPLRAARGRISVDRGSGENRGRLLLNRVGVPACVPVFPIHVAGRQCGVGFNINARYLPIIMRAEQPVKLPHRWHGDTLILDLEPLQHADDLFAGEDA